MTFLIKFFKSPLGKIAYNLVVRPFFWLINFIFYNIKKIIFLLALWFYNNFIKIISPWKKTLYYNWGLYIISMLAITFFMVHSGYLLYDYYAEHVWTREAITLRKEALVFWISCLVFYTLITVISSFYYQAARHWKLYGEAAYSSYLFWYCLFVHWYYSEFELAYVEVSMGYSLFVYLIFFGGMVGIEWEEELDEDWDDAALHNSKIAQDRGVSYLTTVRDEWSEDDMLMVLQMRTTSALQEKLTDIFGNSFDMSQDVVDTLTMYEDWEMINFPELYRPLTPEEDISENIERLLKVRPIEYEDHTILDIFSAWDSKQNWISPEYWEILIYRGQLILRFLNFFKKIFMYFFKYIQKLVSLIYLQQLKIKGNYKSYLIRAVGAYCGYKPRFKVNIEPNLTKDVVTRERSIQPFLLFYIVIRYIKFYILELVNYLRLYFYIPTLKNNLKPTAQSILLEIKIKKLDSWASNNYKFFRNPDESSKVLHHADEELLISLQTKIISLIITFNWFFIFYFIIINIQSQELFDPMWKATLIISIYFITKYTYLKIKKIN